ncbi:MAG: late competence development ComFB family protein [Elainellaceae cyanobacterium]
MAKQICNLVLPIVEEEIEEMLEAYPHHPYRQAFAIPDLRQKLVCYVLSRTPGLYAVVDDQSSTAPPRSRCPLSQQMQIEALIRQGIQHILASNSDWVRRHIPQEAELQLAPSNWFG